MNARTRRNFVNNMMAATAAAMSGSPLIAAPWQDPPAGAPARAAADRAARRVRGRQASRGSRARGSSRSQVPTRGISKTTRG